MKIAFRAASGAFQPGDPVPPSRSFFGGLPSDKQAVEAFLESQRPEQCPKRENAIFLFEDEQPGRMWAARERRALYAVEVEESAVLLRADWCWLQKVMNVLKNNAPEGIDLVRNYWAGRATESPVWELIVGSARIVKEVTIPQQERTLLRLHAFGQPAPFCEKPSESEH